MTKWNNLSKRLPKINIYIYAMDKELSEIAYGKLVVFLDSMNKSGGFFNDFYEHDEEISHEFTEGDLFWKLYGDENKIDNNVCWATVEEYPHWITPEDIIKLVTNDNQLDKEEEIDNRADILDL
jgi:hypothetical protein